MTLKLYPLLSKYTFLKMEMFHSQVYTHMDSLLEDAKTILTDYQLWDWLRNYKPHSNEGFVLDYHPNMVLLYSKLKTKPYSGTEFNQLMVELKKLAKDNTPITN